MSCDLPFTACLTCMAVDFFRRHNREVTQDETGAWWSEGHRLGRCLEEIAEDEINESNLNENGEAA